MDNPRISEDDLVAYVCGDLNVAMQAEIESAMAANPALTAEAARLTRALEAVTGGSSDSPASDFNARLRARLEAERRAAAHPPHKALGRRWRRVFLPAAAAAAVLALGLATAWHWWPAPPEQPQVAVPNVEPGPVSPTPTITPTAPVPPAFSTPGPKASPSNPGPKGTVAVALAPPPPPAPPAPPRPAASFEFLAGPTDFSEGLAARRAGASVGFIDTKGQWVIQPLFFNNLSVFKEGVALVVVGQPGPAPMKTFLIDRTGKAAAIPDTDEKGKKLQYHSTVSEGLAVIWRDDGLFGYANREGKAVIEPRFYRAEPFSEGLGLVQLPPTPEAHVPMAYIDKTGKVVLELKGMSLYTTEDGCFHEGLASVCKEIEKGKWRYGFIDKTGRFVIEPQFEVAARFSEGLAAVRVDGLWGFIDKTGAIVIKPQFKAFRGTAFHEKLARVQVGTLRESNGEIWAFIDTTGKVVIPPDLCGDCEPFSEGLAHVRLPGRPPHEGYIDQTGKLVIELKQ